MAGKSCPEGWTVDKDSENLDNSIALLLDIIHWAERIIDTSDDPEVVQAAVDIVKAARRSQELHISSRPRLLELRRAAKAGGEGRQGLING